MGCSVAMDSDTGKMSRITRKKCFPECGDTKFVGPVWLKSLNTAKYGPAKDYRKLMSHDVGSPLLVDWAIK